MKTGSPPTDPNARTGELTPPGIRVLARANNAADRGRRPAPDGTAPDCSASDISGLLAGISERLEQLQAVGQLVAGRVAHPARGRAAGIARGRRDDVAVPAVPAQSGDFRHFFRLAVQVAGPPFGLVGRSAAGPDKEMSPVTGADRYRAGPQAVPLQLAQCRQAGPD